MSTAAAPTALTRAEPTPLGTRHGDFTHLHAAHCESGVTASLLADAGRPVTEPMAFGIGGGIFFAHLPFVRVMGAPLTTFRSFPGTLFSAAGRRLGVRFASESFRDPAAGMRRLDALLAEGRRVGLQVNIFWLDYIPRHLRIHFNAHNLVVLERRGEEYLISDPVVDSLFACSAASLARARCSGGAALLGRGRLYYPVRVEPAFDLRWAVQVGLRQVCHRMLRIPRFIPWLGAEGVAHLGRRVVRWPERQGEARAREWIASVVRMAEEIGTGGAGFRYLFAAFLQQAGEQLAWPALGEQSEAATALGDAWRRWSVHASRMARGKPDLGWRDLSLGLLALAAQERRFFEGLDRARQGSGAA